MTQIGLVPRAAARVVHRPQILIVDDDPLAIQVLHNVLGDLGQCCFATSGREALEILRGSAMDLVLLDAAMPGLDGFATCRGVRREHPDLPVIFVTAAHDPESEVRALEAGAVDFISKPIQPQVVRARVSTHLKLKAQNDVLQAMILSDPLTGIANRRALDEHLRVEWRRAQRHRQPLSLLMIDIDHFKAYNDHYGHLAGDRCLQRVANAIAGSAGRAGDLAARFGGEEFAVLLPETPLAEAGIAAQNISAAVRDLAIPHAFSPVAEYVTVSIGVAGEVPKLTREHRVAGTTLGVGRGLLDRADAALYVAKAAGRNCVICHEHASAARFALTKPFAEVEMTGGHTNRFPEDAL